MILEPKDGQTLHDFRALVRSRNREVIPRRSGDIIDIYISRGQIIARSWPIDQIYEPSPQYLATQNAVIIERRVEKFLSDADRVALKFRASNSRYNWWEILGKNYIKLAYKHPDRPVGLRLSKMDCTNDRWTIVFQTESRAYERIEIVHRNCYPHPGHYWIDATHREAGLENTLKGREVWHPDFVFDFVHHLYDPTATEFIFSSFVVPEYSVFRVTAYSDGNFLHYAGQTGLYLLTRDNPWWLNAPMSC